MTQRRHTDPDDMMGLECSKMICLNFFVGGVDEQGNGMTYFVRSTVLTAVTCAALLFSVFASQAATFTMEFEGLSSLVPGSGTATTTTNNYTEDSMTMSPTFTHYDVFNNIAGAPPSSGNINVTIHQGNNGSGVQFTYASGNFDALSMDINGWFDTNSDPLLNPVTFSSSAGGIHAIDNTFTGTIDFSAILGFANISSFLISAPNPTFVCSSVKCPQMTFDDFVFRDPAVSAVPLPAALPLFAGGLGLMGIFGWRRKRKAASAA